MAGYVFDPTEPLPRRWTDARGPIRVMCEPVEGYIMARRQGVAPFVLSVRELMSGEYEPGQKPKRVNVRKFVEDQP